MRGRLLSCELHLPGVRGSIVNSDLIPSAVYIYYPSRLIYTSSNKEKKVTVLPTAPKQLWNCMTKLHKCRIVMWKM